MLLFVVPPAISSLGQSPASPGSSLLLYNPPVLSIAKEVTEVNLAVSITDRKGHFIRNLTINDMTIQDNAQPPDKITSFAEQTQLPLRIAIVIDGSDSMKYALGQEKSAARNFLKGVFHPVSDMALIIGFTEHTEMAQPATANVELLSRALKTLHGGGETAVYDAVITAVDALQQIKDRQPCRRLVVLLTDGQDNSSVATLDTAIAAAQRNDVSVYVLNVGYFVQDSQTAMKILCESTGGMCISSHDETTIDFAFSKLERDLRSQYAICYKPLNAAADGSFHQITIQASKKLRLRYRHGYFAQ